MRLQNDGKKAVVCSLITVNSAQDVIDKYYAPLPSNILNPVRIVEGVFDLSPVDIESLDLMTPVYLDQYGDYFYIQKVNNYEAGQLTKVSLVCLNVTKNNG